jgi:hypothetical protein
MLSLWHKSGLVVQLICCINGQQIKRRVLKETQVFSYSIVSLCHKYICLYLASQIYPFNLTLSP